MKNQVSNIRTSLNPVFTTVVKENHAKILRLDARMKKLTGELAAESEGNGDNSIERRIQIQLLEKDLAVASLIVIVFSAMAIEAYIYDYAARHLGDAFVKDHLDKLDTLSKWVVIPKLITGREMSRHEGWHGLLRKLITARNSIIHYKSSEPPVSIPDLVKYLEKRRENSKILLESARQAITLLDTLADKITEIDPEETPWVKSYLT